MLFIKAFVAAYRAAKMNTGICITSSSLYYFFSFLLTVRTYVPELLEKILVISFMFYLNTNY